MVAKRSFWHSFQHWKNKSKICNNFHFIMQSIFLSHQSHTSFRPRKA